MGKTMVPAGCWPQGLGLPQKQDRTRSLEDKRDRCPEDRGWFVPESRPVMGEV